VAPSGPATKSLVIPDGNVPNLPLAAKAAPTLIVLSSASNTDSLSGVERVANGENNSSSFLPPYPQCHVNGNNYLDERVGGEGRDKEARRACLYQRGC
jgi:hypothetical protein